MFCSALATLHGSNKQQIFARIKSTSGFLYRHFKAVNTLHKVHLQKYVHTSVRKVCSIPTDNKTEAQNLVFDEYTGCIKP